MLIKENKKNILIKLISFNNFFRNLIKIMVKILIAWIGFQNTLILILFFINNL